MKTVCQGDIYLADLNPVKGHEQGGFRPILVVQNNILNANLNTVLIAPITKTLTAKGFLTTYFLEKKHLGLKFDSIALLYQLRTIDKLRLRKRLCRLSGDEMKNVKDQLRLLF